MNAVEWFSAKCIFRHIGLSDDPSKNVYEERIVIVQGRDIHEALEKAEAEARRYATTTKNVEYLGYIIAYDITEKTLSDGCEVFSLMRESSLSSEEYLNRFHDDGAERVTRTPQSH